MAKITGVQYVSVESAQSGRRIDNFLIHQLKGVPKARIYQMIRKGEVRVNGSRVKQNHRVDEDDVVRIPPVVKIEADPGQPQISEQTVDLLTRSIIFEDDYLLVLNKPSGMVVHGGSGQQHGLIEILRSIRQDLPFLELAHRLDKETSGCIVLAKSADILKELHRSLSHQTTFKSYLAFVKGKFPDQEVEVSQPLKKNTLAGGERVVRVHPEGKTALTRFRKLKQFAVGSLVEAEILTGRTHQIRVHASHIHHPIAMDTKYGDKTYNKMLKQTGLNRMFLHSETIKLSLSVYSDILHFTAPLDRTLREFLNRQQVSD